MSMFFSGLKSPGRAGPGAGNLAYFLDTALFSAIIIALER
jgi:hypothetical protein